MRSAPPPGGYVTTSRMGFVGNVCAEAQTLRSSEAARAERDFFIPVE
jgi:hypothetical protein